MKIIMNSTLAVIIAGIIALLSGCGDGTTQPGGNDDTNYESPPLPPENLRAIAMSLSSLLLVWDDRSDNEAGFEIFESEENDSSFALIFQTDANVDSFLINDVDLSRKYFYTIRAYNRFGASAYTDTVAIAGGQLLRTIEAGEAGLPLAIDFGPYGSSLLAGYADYKTRRFDPRTGELIQELVWHTYPVNEVAYSPDSARFASSSSDGTVKVWNHYRVAQEHVFTPSATALEFSPDGNYLAMSGALPRVYRMEDGVLMWQDTVGAQLLRYTPDNRFLLSAYGNWLKIRDPISGDSLGTILAGCSDLVISPGGEYAAATGNEYKIILYQVVDSDGLIDFVELTRFEGHTRAITCLDFSWDSKWLASGSLDHSVLVWDVINQVHRSTLMGHTSDIKDVDFSPGGMYLATAGGDQKIILWNAFF